MHECSKSVPRRMSDANYINRYFVGDGIDIGGKPDPLGQYAELFCRMGAVRIWDLEDGDAQYLKGIPDDHYGFVHSSHCLEHLRDPAEGLRNWLRVLQPGGHLVVTVPDEDMYEQGMFPSTFNDDHKWTFTVFKTHSWSSHSVNITDLISETGVEIEVIKIERLTSTFRFSVPRFDQTLTPIGECGIEIVLRKCTVEDIEAGGRLPQLPR